MKSTRSSPKPVSAETIARLADQGKDVSRFFTNRGRMMTARRGMQLTTRAAKRRQNRAHGASRG